MNFGLKLNVFGENLSDLRTFWEGRSLKPTRVGDECSGNETGGTGDGPIRVDSQRVSSKETGK